MTANIPGSTEVVSCLIVHHPQGGHCSYHMGLHEVWEDQKSRYLCNINLSSSTNS